MWTTKEFADEFKLGRTTVVRMINDGCIKAVRVGRNYRIADDEVERIRREGVENETKVVN